MTGTRVTGRGGLVARLRAAGVPTPEVDARLLARHAGGDAALLERLVARRAAREPLQLIVGAVGFRYLEIAVEPGVFIPRPETEVLAGAALERLPAGGVAVEPCTGSGAVACAVAQEGRPARVVATDCDPRAVALARRNAAAFPVVEVVLGDLLEPVEASLRGRVDVLVANPPYLAAGEVDGLEPEVAVHDPHVALVAGPTGHEVCDALVDAAPGWLARGGWLLLEVDPSRAAATAARCGAVGLAAVAVLPDLTGRDRVVVARHAG